MTLEEMIRKFSEENPPIRVKPRTCLYLQDKVTGDDVEIVSEDLVVKSEPVKEKTSGDQ